MFRGKGYVFWRTKINGIQNFVQNRLWKSPNPQLKIVKFIKIQFNVKPDLGFYAWAKPQVTLRSPDDSELQKPIFIREAFMNFFQDETKRDKYIELNSIEHKKGEDTFSMDKALLYCSLIEELGPNFVNILVPYVQKFCASSEESEQRCAAEIIFGMIRGSRFWSYKPASLLWNQILIPCFKVVLSNLLF